MFVLARCSRLGGVNRILALFALLSAAGLAISLDLRWCLAGQGTDINKVEEYWQVQLNTPNAARGTPQLNFLTSATGNADGYYAIFVINQRDGAIGGLQLQLWNGNTLLATSSSSNTAALATPNESLSWKTRLSLGNNGVLTAEIVGFSSTTWGSVGTNTTFPGLTVSAATNLSDLNSYDLNVSAANTGIDFGTTRVGKITLKKVVSYTGNQKSTDQLASDKVIYSYP